MSLIRQRKSLQEIYMKKLTEGSNANVYETPSPSQPQITPYGEQFMEEIMNFMEEQMDNPDLTVNELADHLKMSRTIFYRKLRAIVGLAPVDFIREVRIKRATSLLTAADIISHKLLTWQVSMTRNILVNALKKLLE